MARDDFSAATKKILEERAGHCCSFPGCSAVTTGPSDESSTAISKTGMACHIAAASGGQGARRYVASMSSEERLSPENGIWMCYTHGKIIDTDEKRYSSPMLQKWREMAYFRARFRQEFGTDKQLPRDRLVEIGFANETLSFTSPGNEAKVIGFALLDSCVPLVWGDELSHAVRDVLVEIVRNTFAHGGASSCKLVIYRRSISITDDGADFSWLNLPTSPNARGGAAAVKSLFAHFGDKLLLGVKRHNNENRTTIALARSLDDIKLVGPCSVEVKDGDWNEVRNRRQIPASWFPSTTESCRIFYIVLPEFMPHSDAILLSEALQPEAIKNKQIVFVTQNTSSGVERYLLEAFPFARVLNISST